MYTWGLCKLDLLDSSVQTLGDGFLSFRSASGETFIESSKAWGRDEEVGGIYRCSFYKTDSLIYWWSIFENVREGVGEI